MARGRMISKTLGTSQKYAKLTGSLGEFAAALFPLLISHCDDFGRLESDAFTIKVRVWPTSRRSEKQFQNALLLLDKVGLISVYVVDGQQFSEVVNFSDHQQGLHKRTRSKFPPAPGTVDPTPSKVIPIAPPENGKSRVGIFMQKYEEMYFSILKQPYLGNDAVRKSKDMSAAHELCGVYSDKDLLTMTEFFLRVDPEKNAKARFMAGKQRTIPMMKVLIGDIASHLKIKAKVVSA